MSAGQFELLCLRITRQREFVPIHMRMHTPHTYSQAAYERIVKERTNCNQEILLLTRRQDQYVPLSPYVVCLDLIIP